MPLLPAVRLNTQYTPTHPPHPNGQKRPRAQEGGNQVTRSARLGGLLLRGEPPARLAVDPPLALARLSLGLTRLGGAPRARTLSTRAARTARTARTLRAGRRLAPLPLLQLDVAHEGALRWAARLGAARRRARLATRLGTHRLGALALPLRLRRCLARFRRAARLVAPAPLGPPRRLARLAAPASLLRRLGLQRARPAPALTSSLGRLRLRHRATRLCATRALVLALVLAAARRAARRRAASAAGLGAAPCAPGDETAVVRDRRVHPGEVAVGREHTAHGHLR
eukprot:scaffold28020_cov52-Phaeocystis_antarctica.AAC.2